MSPVTPHDALSVLSRHLPPYEWNIVVDLEASHGSRLVDGRDGREYLDLFSFFSSLPLGMNHPGLAGDPEFVHAIGRAALHKPSNCDVATVPYASFVATFARVLGVPELPRLFFIDGGALAVENALKIAFDWKARRQAAGGRPRDINYRVLHLTSAFHGRSGYTLSLTNTDAAKTALFPRWDWPRLPTPSAHFPPHEHPGDLVSAEARTLEAARRILEASDDIACFIAEPILCEGGDIHLRAEFLLVMQRLCHEHDILFVLDEVQTGGGATGAPWLHKQLGLAPDLVAFGKKTQVCGVMGGRRVDLVPDNAFVTPSRISSTWSGNLADMVRATRILEIIERDNLFARAADLGDYLLRSLWTMAADRPNLISNVRGRGLLCALDLPTPAARDNLILRLYRDHDVLILPCGDRSVRFRPALTIEKEDLDLTVEAIAAAADSTVAPV